jgi:hypothetical protein
MRKFSRRELAALMLGLLFRPGRTAAQVGAGTTLRRYRADAVILLLGLPIYKRAAVGGGQVSVEETREGGQLRRTLFFAGGSDPKRAQGLKRIGWIREVVLGSESIPSQADYFGVLTSSPEESLENARKSVAGPQSGQSLFTAVNGRHTAGQSRSAITHFEFSSEATWYDHALIAEAESTFRSNVAWRENARPNSPNQAPPTFLLQLATLLKQRSKHAAGRYVYNEQEYTLELDTSTAGRLIAVRGKVRNQQTGHQTPFRLWIENASESVIPVRIEFQPRSFLRLTFEALPA